jgi:hypothetical protein
METLTPRVGLRIYGSGTDTFTRIKRNADIQGLEDSMALDASGPVLPAPATVGRYFHKTDTDYFYRDTSAAWKMVGQNVQDWQTTASASGVVPATVKGAGGQTANLLEVKNSANVVLFSVGPTGAVSSSGKLVTTLPGDVLPSANNHSLQIGPLTGAHLRGDYRSIQAANNGANSALFINPYGGNVNVGSASSVVTVPGPLDVNSAATFRGDTLVRPSADGTAIFAIDTTAGSPVVEVDTVNKRMVIGGTVASRTLDVRGKFAALVTDATPSSTSAGTHWLRAPKNAATVYLGENEATNAYGVDESSADLRFNGVGVGYGDVGYYPNGGSGYGEFRFSITGDAITRTPNARVGAGEVYVASRIMVGTTSPTAGVDCYIRARSIVRPSTDSTTAFRVTQAAGETSAVLTVDTVNKRVGIGTGAATPASPLHVAPGAGSPAVLADFVPGTGALADSGFIAVNGRARFGWDPNVNAVTIDDAGGTKNIYFNSGNSNKFFIVGQPGGYGDVGVGPAGGSVHVATATQGFFFMPACSGPPTGVPNNYGTGCIATIIDTVNNRIYFRSGASWRYCQGV